MAHDEEPQADYPRGRGYGHDYMRGGEVFGGYGYSSREEYERPRGAQEHTGEDDTEGEEAAPADEAQRPEEASAESAAGDIEPDRFPQDERAGGWEVPPPLPTDGPTAPVPQIEHTYGSTGGNHVHSRSYYVTQAQLQQRIYRVRGGEGR